MLKSFLKPLSVVLLAGIAFVHAAHAAQISENKHDDRVVVLEGVIVPGDYERLSQFIHSSLHTRIFLGSPGGDLGEAMKIGRLLREFKYQTIVPSKGASEGIRKQLVEQSGLQNPQKNYVCAGACFFAFVGGIQRGIDFGENGSLGIGRPEMSDAQVQPPITVGATSAIPDTRAVVNAYLKEMGVPAKYGDAMFAIQGDGIKWIDSESFAADFKGFAPEMTDWVKARCNDITDTDRKAWDALQNKTRTPADNLTVEALLKKWSEQYRCEYDLQAALATAAYDEVLRTGKLRLR